MSILLRFFNQFFSAFVEVIKLAINRHAPLKKLSRRLKRLNEKPWITKGILVSIWKKRKLHRPHFLSQIPSNVIFTKNTEMCSLVLKPLLKKCIFIKLYMIVKTALKNLGRFAVVVEWQQEVA